MSTEKKQIAELVKFANQRLQAQQGKPLDDCDQSILEQALQGKKLKDIQVKGFEENTIRTVRAPALWKTLSQLTDQKIGIRNLQQALQAAYTHYKQTTTVSVQTEDHSSIFENLPAPTCTRFIGRSSEIDRLMELLSPKHSAHLITISGIGGMGKTSLAVECARRCLTASQKSIRTDYIPRFEVFLFVSAKLSHLGFEGLIPRLDPARSLTDILQQIADALGNLNFAGLDLREQMRLLIKVFLQKRTLLIVDNLETVDNQNEVIGFLFDLPPSVKVILTTREQREYGPVRLTALNEQDTLSLVEHEINTRQLTLTKEQRQALCQATSGVPLAINYMMGQLQSGCTVGEVLEGIYQPTHQVAQYCFEAMVQPMRGKSSHQILMALALLPAPVRQTALVTVAIPDQDSATANAALADLRRLLLVEQKNYRYSMLPMTQEYMLAELKNNPDFAAIARQRWIDWYLQFTQTYAERDAISWQTQFDDLPEEWPNIQAIAQWCMTTDQYANMLQLWRNLEAYTYAMGRKQNRLVYWTDRLNWTAWLITASQQQADLQTTTQVMLDRAWTLVTTRRAQLLPEAEQLFQQIWDLRHYQTVPFHRDVALKRAVLHLEKNEFAIAQLWFKTTEELMSQVRLNEQERQLQTMELRYYRGRCDFQLDAISAAKQHFEESRRIALSLQNERMVRIVENWLADIAVIEGNFQQAEQWLEEGLRMGKNNQDLPQIAFTHRSLAKLYAAKGHSKQAKKYAIEAIKLFTKLEMMNQAEDTQTWLDGLTTVQSAQN